MTDIQRNTILAALRHYQRSIADGVPADLAGIATNDGASRAMTPDEIDSLCEALSSQDTQPMRVAVHLEGGTVRCAIAEPGAMRPVDVYVIDYDTEGADPSELTGVTQGDGSVAEAYVVAHRVLTDSDIRLSDVFGETSSTPDSAEPQAPRSAPPRMG